MKVIKRESTHQTPKVILDAENEVFEISGVSIPENSVDFYYPLFDWFEEYLRNPNEKTIFKFNFKYFNSASSKLILDIVLLLKKLYKADNDVLVKWYVEEDDEDMEESGRLYESVSELPFEFIICEPEYTEPNK